VLRSIFATWGMPEELAVDNGPPCNSVAVAEFLRRNHVKHKLTPVYHPSSNGQIERGVRTLKQSLLKQLTDDRTADGTLQHKIDSWLFAYRNTRHTLTKVSPAEVFLGRRPRTPPVGAPPTEHSLRQGTGCPREVER
jgi:transposase InsO family protein